MVPAVAAVAADPPLAPAGFRFATPAEMLPGAALVGRSILYPGRWLVQGWSLGKVVWVSQAAG